jgi:hypothetical protein
LATPAGPAEPPLAADRPSHPDQHGAERVLRVCRLLVDARSWSRRVGGCWSWPSDRLSPLRTAAGVLALRRVDSSQRRASTAAREIDLSPTEDARPTVIVAAVTDTETGRRALPRPSSRPSPDRPSLSPCTQHAGVARSLHTSALFSCRLTATTPTECVGEHSRIAALPPSEPSR